MKIKLFSLTCIAILFPLINTQLSAQGIEFASSPNPVGSGARALGMGGAFIAVADDATAASWNPGGLIQLEHPELSIVGAWYHRSEDNTFGGHPEADGSQSISEGNLNYLSAVYPFSWLEKNMVVALTYQHLYDFNRSWDFSYLFPHRDWISNQKVVYNQEGGLSAIGLSYAIQATPSLSFGATLNIWDDNLGYNNWEQDKLFIGQGRLEPFSIKEVIREIDKYSFSGINFNLGALWRVTEALTVGLVYKTPFTAEIEHFQSLNVRFDIYPNVYFSETEKYHNLEEELEMPASYGIGVGYRFSDKLTASFDLYRTEWQDMIYVDHAGERTSAISGVNESLSDIEATIQARVGAEYLIIKPKYVIPLRAGIFYDPAPSEGTSDDFYGIALGTGVAIGSYIFDIGYQFRFGNDVGSAILKIEDGELSQDVREHTLYTSFIFHF